jgi:hypothetical protein
LRNAGRLATAQALAAERRLPRHAGDRRQCDGRPFPPAPRRDAPTDQETNGNEAAPAEQTSPPPPTMPLTAEPAR